MKLAENPSTLLDNHTHNLYPLYLTSNFISFYQKIDLSYLTGFAINVSLLKVAAFLIAPITGFHKNAQKFKWKLTNTTLQGL